jgi:hypothetical protein
MLDLLSCPIYTQSIITNKDNGVTKTCPKNKLVAWAKTSLLLGHQQVVMGNKKP